jgi:hypothetical protein
MSLNLQKEFIMNAIVKTAALIVSLTAANFGISAAHAAQPYLLTNGEVGLIANPAVQYKGPADKTAGIYLVGVGEQGLVANPTFKGLSATATQPLFTVGVGEQGLVEIKQARARSTMAMKASAQ